MFQQYCARLKVREWLHVKHKIFVKNVWQMLRIFDCCSGVLGLITRLAQWTGPDLKPIRLCSVNI